MDGPHFALQGSLQQAVNERQFGPEQRRLFHIGGMFRETGENRRRERHLLLFGEIAQLIQLLAAFVLVFDQLERGVHSRPYCRGELQAGGGLLFGRLQDRQGLPGLAQLVGDVPEINSRDIGLAQ